MLVRTGQHPQDGEWGSEPIMNMQKTRMLCCISHPTDEEGARPLVGNQSATGTNSTPEVYEDHHREESPQRGRQFAPPTVRARNVRLKWTREEYKEVIEAYFIASLNPTGTLQTVLMRYGVRNTHIQDQTLMPIILLTPGVIS